MEKLRAVTTYNNPALHDVIRSYVIVAIRLCADQFGSTFPLGGVSGIPVFLHLDKHLNKTSEYMNCRTHLTQDSNISSHLDILVGISEIRRTSPTIQQLMRHLPYLGIYQNKTEFNEQFFEREYVSFENAFYASDLTYEVVVPLHGTLFEAPIKLNEALEICRINSTDLTVPLDDDPTEDSRFGNPLWAIRASYQIPKILGQSDDSRLDGSKSNEGIRDAVNETIETVVTCLRLSGARNIYALRNIHRTKSWFFDDVREFPIRYLPTRTYTESLGGDYKDALIGFWEIFQRPDIHAWKRVVLAAKRYSYAHERHGWEDRIIDLLIAAEALFVPEIGDNTELKYRLKLHAALFLATEYEGRKKIFDDIGLAYDLRSGIVHGSAALDKRIKKIEQKEVNRFGEEYKLDEFTYRIQEYIRISVCKMLSIAAENPNSDVLVDWESFLLKNVVEPRK